MSSVNILFQQKYGDKVLTLPFSEQSLAIILINNQTNPAQLQNETPVAMEKVINLTSTLSEHLENQGMPQKLINVGVKKGNPEMVELVFRKYVPFSPKDPELVVTP